MAGGDEAVDVNKHQHVAAGAALGVAHKPSPRRFALDNLKHIRTQSKLNTVSFHL